MKTYVQRLKWLATTSVLAATFLTVPVTVSAQTNAVDDIRSGVGQGPAGGASLGGTIAVVINILSIIVAVAAVIIIIIGGLKYVLSSGDSARVNSAKDTILFAIVGLIIVALAQIIVRFVLGKV